MIYGMELGGTNLKLGFRAVLIWATSYLGCLAQDMNIKCACAGFVYGQK